MTIILNNNVRVSTSTQVNTSANVGLKRRNGIYGVTSYEIQSICIAENFIYNTMVTIHVINQILPFVQWSKYRNWCCSCKHRYYCPVSNLKDDHSIPDFNNNNLYPYKYVRFNVILAMIKVGNKRQAYMRIKTNMPYATPCSTLLETNVISN